MKAILREKYIVASLLCIHAAMLAWGAHRHSPTLNEPAHLASGIAVWKLGRFDFYRVNPPLTRMVASLPVFLAGVNTDWHDYRGGPGARPEYAVSDDFVAVNGARSFLLLTLARWACIPLSLLGGGVCFRWAKELYGRKAGLLALTLWCFSPNILAHAQLITPDVAATALGLTAVYTLWRWLRQPTWWHTLVSGFALGMAELAKTTLLVLVPLWPLLWLSYRCSRPHGLRKRDWLRQAGMLAAQILLAVCVINLGYALEGTGTPLGDFRFVSAALGAHENQEGASSVGGNRFADRWIAALPVPLPRNYVLGIDQQKRDFESYLGPSYLGGEFRHRGWWYYYLYAVTIKVPLGTWLLICLAATMGIWAKAEARLREELMLLAPAAVVLAFVSSQTGFSEHMRYVLPAFPFLFIWISRVAALFDRQRRVLARVALGALAWSVSSSLWICPHSLSYFNELVGGPAGGPAHLIHSNVDWGQDLLFLKHWLDAHPHARPLKLAYFGPLDPCYAGLEYTAPEDLRMNEHSKAHIPPGWYAVSVNLVRGYPYIICKGDGSRGGLGQNALAVFQECKPVAMAGYSIYVYHVTQTNRVDSTYSDQDGL